MVLSVLMIDDFFFNKENLLTIIPTTSTPAIFMWCAVQIGVTLEFTIKRGNKHYLKSLKIIEYTQKVTWKACRKWTALFQKLFDLSLGKMPMIQIKAVLFEKSFKFISVKDLTKISRLTFGRLVACDRHPPIFNADWCWCWNWRETGSSDRKLMIGQMK